MAKAVGNLQHAICDLSLRNHRSGGVSTWMGGHIGIARVLGFLFLRLSIGLMAITTGDMQCLFDVLGGDLVVKGTQHQSLCIYCLQCCIVNMAAIIQNS